MKERKQRLEGLPDTRSLFRRNVTESVGGANRIYDSGSIAASAVAMTACGAGNLRQIHALLEEKGEVAKKLLGAGKIPHRDTIGDRVARMDPAEVQKMLPEQSRLLAGAMEDFDRKNRSRRRRGKAKKSKKRKARKERRKQKHARSGNHRIQGRRVFALDGTLPLASKRPAEGREAYDILNVMDVSAGLWRACVLIPNKGHEQTFSRELIESAGLEPGDILTFDAGITCRETLRLIAGSGLDYVAAVKGNSGRVYRLARGLFDSVDERSGAQAALGPGVRVASVLGDDSKFSGWTDKGWRNGQMEIRTYQTYMSTDFLPGEVLADYPSLAGVGRARRVVYKRRDLKGGVEFWERSVEEVLYLISFGCSCRDFAYIARFEWGVEGTGHHVQDCSFGEDHFKAKREEVQANLAVFRRMAQNLLTYFRHVTGWKDAGFPELMMYLRERPLLAVQLILGEFEGVESAGEYARADARDYARKLLESLPGFDSPEKGRILEMAIDELRKVRGPFG